MTRRTRLQVPPLPEAAQRELKALVPFASPRNPIDLTAQPFTTSSLVARNIEIALREGSYTPSSPSSARRRLTAIAEPMRQAIRELQSIRPDCLFRAVSGYPGRAAVGLRSRWRARVRRSLARRRRRGCARRLRPLLPARRGRGRTLQIRAKARSHRP